MRIPLLLASLALAVVAFSAVASAQEASAPEWKDQSFKECRCSATFPGTPTTKTQSMQTKVGNLDSTMIMLEVPNQAFYALAYVDYPKDAISSSKPDNLLDGARDGAVGKVKGTLKNETRITMQGYPGRELLIEAPGGPAGNLQLHARIYMVKERLYQSLVVAPAAKADSPEVKKFLDSFKFQKP